MISQTVARLEEAIRGLKSGDPRRKEELVRLLTQLKGEISRMGEAQAEHARSIAGFAEVAAHEATRRQRSEKLLSLSREGLSQSVKEFELTHPRLTEAVNELCTFLSGLGI